MKKLIGYLYWHGCHVSAYRMYFTVAVMGVALVLLFPIFQQAGFHGLVHVPSLLQGHDPWE